MSISITMSRFKDLLRGKDLLWEEEDLVGKDLLDLLGKDLVGKDLL